MTDNPGMSSEVEKQIMQEVENESSLETGGWLNIHIVRALDTGVIYPSGNGGQETEWVSGESGPASL